MVLLFIPRHECWDPENQGRLKDLAFLELRAKSLGGGPSRLCGLEPRGAEQWGVEGRYWLCRQMDGLQCSPCICRPCGLVRISQPLCACVSHQ